jgi:hypothetical protein
MKSSRDLFAFDDNCFLFLNLKIDGSLFHQLPIELAPGISLASTPQHALAQAAGKSSTERENIALAEWVYPGFGLGMGIVNACIKIDSSVPVNLRNRYFWFMVSALYLTKPLYINISGSFSYGNEEGFLGRTPSRILKKSNISLNTFFSHANGENLLQYNEEDFKQAGVYFARFVEIFNSRKTASRPYYVLKAFFEATLWEQSTYASTSFSKLFPLIDAFTGNPTHKHELKASTRLSLFLKELPSKFLKNPLSEEEIKSRIASIWQLHRGPDLHGFLKEPDAITFDDPNKIPVDSEELKDLFDLMEFSRLAIIKMLLLDDSSFKEYCDIPIPKRRYSSKEERTSDESNRDELGKKFFEENFYAHPKELIAYTNFSEFSNQKFESEIEDQKLASV